MATTKIWSVRDNLKRVVEYAENHLKTAKSESYSKEELADLRDVLEYGADGAKTEQQFYVTGVNCMDEFAYQQMMKTKVRFGKTDGNLAYHCYQSFKPDEVTPDTAHKIGIELAKRLWGDKYEVVVSTHLNTNCVHNHFVVNSVSFVDGKKFNNNYAMYFKYFRLQSDKICREYGLSVVENPSPTKTPRNIYLAEINGEPTRYNVMRSDIDAAVSQSFTITQMEKYLKSLGYVLNFNPRHKYWTIAFVGDNRATRLERLGAQYSRNSLNERILSQVNHPKPLPQIVIRQVRCRGNIHKGQKLKGIYALYIKYCFMLGVLPKNNHRQPISAEMRMELRKLDKLSEVTKLLCKHKISTQDELKSFIAERRQILSEFGRERGKVYNKLKSAKTPEQVTELKSDRDRLSEAMKILRRELFCADDILKNTEKRREILAKEMKIKYQPLPKQKTKEREKNYAK